MKLFGGAAKFASFNTNKGVSYTPIANGTKFGQNGVAYVKAADKIWNWDALYSINSEMHSGDWNDEKQEYGPDYYSNKTYYNSVNDIVQGAPIPPMHKVMILNGNSIIWGKLVVRPTDPSNSNCYTTLSAYVQYKSGNETVESIIYGGDSDSIYDKYGFTDYITIGNNHCPVLVLKRSNTLFTATKSEYTLAQAMEMDDENTIDSYFVPEEFAGIFKFRYQNAESIFDDYYVYEMYNELLAACDPTKTVYLLNNN